MTTLLKPAGENYISTYDTKPYYLACQIIATGRGAKLYDYQVQRQYSHKLFYREYLRLKQNYHQREDRSGFLVMPFVSNYYYYPPTTVPLLALLGGFSQYQLYIFTILATHAILLVLLGMVLCTKRSKLEDLLLVLALILFSLPFTSNLYQGQISWLVSSGAFFYFFFARRKQNFWAGLSLGILCFKPQLGLPFLIVPLLKRDYQSLVYCFLSTIFLVLLSLNWIGLEGMRDYYFSILSLFGEDPVGYVYLPPEHPVRSLPYLVSTFLRLSNQSGFCSLSEKHLLDIIQIFWLSIGISALGFLYISKRKDLFTLLLASLIAFMLPTYHTLADYGFVVIILFVAIFFIPKLAKNLSLTYGLLFGLFPQIFLLIASFELTRPEKGDIALWLSTLIVCIWLCWSWLKKKLNYLLPN
ncbi:MAG: glycosyltransferase family 87 protein [Candidatus Caenarcaniphilales bacterium]|nr:glycosyltransferase family 87 protein [Candidatus Caenarcaniphilales bacterium]